MRFCLIQLTVTVITLTGTRLHMTGASLYLSACWTFSSESFNSINQLPSLHFQILGFYGKYHQKQKLHISLYIMAIYSVGTRFPRGNYRFCLPQPAMYIVEISILLSGEFTASCLAHIYHTLYFVLSQSASDTCSSTCLESTKTCHFM